MSIRVRIAPSPTGPMHVGTARTALFNWIFAKKNKGVFILRIEDTDAARSLKKFEENIMQSLLWLGLKWDEGPTPTASGNFQFSIPNFQTGGKSGPYRQSGRGKIYKKYIEKLLESGDAFYCYHTKEELKKEKQGQIQRKEAPRHVCEYKDEDSNKTTPTSTLPIVKGGGGYVIRFRNPGGKIKFNDLIRGEIEFDADLLGDFSIAKPSTSSGQEIQPLYNFAAVVDDYEMKISHVIRGEDHISNTPKQILIFKGLNLKEPKYAHLPLILGSDKSKLSKRHGAASLFEYKEMGYLPDAMFNFLALLGWSPKDDKEILSRGEIVEQFSLERVQQSGAVFNTDKLDWINGEYIRKMPLDELTKRCERFLPKNGGLDLKKIVALEQSRMKRLSEIGEMAEFFFVDKLDYDLSLLKWKDMSDGEVKEVLAKLEKILSGIGEGDYTKEKLEQAIMPIAEAGSDPASGKVDRGRTLWPLRVSLTGRRASPGPFEIMEILGKQKSLSRLREARKLVGG